ncbi:copper chaperone PCu(A)C [Congregibacter sp.]|uniref:copper chaperone PCu(A)C n=1 Tax=Congregibacter sp. TaxID=2744308 RepID=UPI00385BBAC8
MIDVRVPLIVFISAFSASIAAETLQLSNAWVRAMPPGQKMTAAYFQVRNPSASAITIKGVSSSAGMASLHETRLEGGRSTMQPVNTLTIEAEGVIELEPGGLHIMLMGLQSTPAEGDTVPVCLQTNEGESCTDAQVRRAAPEAKSKHDHH